MKDYLETECVEKIKKECLLQVFDEIDSTNEYLKKLVKREASSLALSPYIALKLRKVLSAAAKEEVKIKWPNDLYCFGGKTAGILTEVIQKKGMAYLIIGVGINLATDPEVVRNINSPVGSLFKHIEPEELERVRSLILSCACEEIIRAVRSLPEKFSAEEIKEWNHSDLYKGRKLRLIEGEKIVSEGQNMGIDKKGRILLQDGNQQKAFCIGEASLRL